MNAIYKSRCCHTICVACCHFGHVENSRRLPTQTMLKMSMNKILVIRQGDGSGQVLEGFGRKAAMYSIDYRDKRFDHGQSKRWIRKSSQTLSE